GIGTNAVLRGAEELSREIDARAVGEMPAMVEAHPQDGIARLHQREIGASIGLRARVRLQVGVSCSEELLRPVDGELLGDVDVFAAAVVPLARIAFRVFVREHRTLRLEHPRTHIVFRSDELDVIFLAALLTLECAVELGVEAADVQALREHFGGPCRWKRVESGILPEGLLAGDASLKGSAAGPRCGLADASRCGRYGARLRGSPPLNSRRWRDWSGRSRRLRAPARARDRACPRGRRARLPPVRGHAA